MIRLIMFITLLGFIAGCASKTTPAWVNSTVPSNGAVGYYYLDNAPFPDDSRKDGYERNGVKYEANAHYLDNTVAVYIPQGFDQQQPVTVLYYFHGHENSVRNALLEFRLMEMVYESGKNIVLIFPEGPVDAPDSGGGKLEKENGLRNLHEEVIGELVSDGKLDSKTVDYVYLSGHSGAYKILHNSLAKGGLNNLVSEVYLLDSSYGGLEDFTNWIAANPDKRFISIYTDHLEDENKEMMTTLTNKKVSYRMLTEDNAFGHVLRDNQRIFIHANKSDHNGTVALLQELLQTSNSAPRGTVLK